MSPFSIPIALERLEEAAQNLNRPSPVVHESALETEADVGQVTEEPLTLHSNLSFFQLSERARRPSAVRNDSDPVFVLKDGTYESSVTTLQVEGLTPAQAHAITYPSRSTTDPIAHRKKVQKARTMHMIAACWCLFVQGWNDGSTGPLLPIIQKNYGIDFIIVSLLFVFNCLGFIIGAGANLWLTGILGLGKVMVLGSFIQFCAYIVMIPAPPFPVFALAYFMCGFALSIQNAQANGLVGSLKEHKSTKLSILHACYGLGAFTSPFPATHFSHEKHWSFHYIISASLAISNTFVLSYVFRFKRQDELLAEAGQEPPAHDSTGPVKGSVFNQILRLRVVHLLTIFAIIYIGVEVTVGGWIVTFIIDKRSGGPEAGYISSGFFGGLTLGRIGLIWLNRKIGEHRAIFVYSLIAIGLEITIWFVPSIIENFIAIAFIGIVLGPMFPIVVSHASRVVPQSLLTGCVGWIAGLGMCGSAALPFITGVVASKYGIGSLQPLMVIMMCIMVGTWALVPKGGRRVD